MTRCLDCGSARISDQCPFCGLTSAAAEYMFRKRLIKQTTFFLAGSLLFPYLTQIYPPLDLDLMLVFFGVLFFIALGIAVILDRRARKHQEIEILKRVYAGFIPLPWILGFAIFLNGKLDSATNRSSFGAGRGQILDEGTGARDSPPGRAILAIGPESRTSPR